MAVGASCRNFTESILKQIWNRLEGEHLWRIANTHFELEVASRKCGGWLGENQHFLVEAVLNENLMVEHMVGGWACG